MPLEFRNLGDDPVDYLTAWELQRQVHARVVGGHQPDTVLLLEHPPVFTAGKRTDPSERPLDPGGAQVIDVDRGGKITFHGPGQLVGYPIVRLPDHVRVVDYVRRVEEALIAVCADFQVTTARIPGRSGVWLREDQRGPERKIAALGIRVSRGVTMHGFALNCDVDLAWYDRFVPCGIADAGVTSLSKELGRDVTVCRRAVQRREASRRAAGVGAVHPDPGLRRQAGAGSYAADPADLAGGLSAEAIPRGCPDVSFSVEMFSRAERTDDAALVAGFALGDEAAATAFVRRFQSRVFGLALSITRDEGLAEDVSQEVFVRAWRAGGNYDPRRASALTWLLTITRNAAIDTIRAKRPLPLADDTLERIVGATLAHDGPEYRAEVADESSRAVERLRALPVEQARVVVLALMGGCTAAEISEREQIPLGTAKTRLRSGLRRLRDAMKEERNV